MSTQEPNRPDPSLARERIVVTIVVTKEPSWWKRNFSTFTIIALLVLLIGGIIFFNPPGSSSIRIVAPHASAPVVAQAGVATTATSPQTPSTPVPVSASPPEKAEVKADAAPAAPTLPPKPVRSPPRAQARARTVQAVPAKISSARADSACGVNFCWRNFGTDPFATSRAAAMAGRERVFREVFNLSDACVAEAMQKTASPGTIVRLNVGDHLDMMVSKGSVAHRNTLIAFKQAQRGIEYTALAEAWTVFCGGGG